MKQQKKIAVATSSTELAISTQALALKGEIEACHRDTLRAGNEMVQAAYRCGELLIEVRDVLKASKTSSFENWIEQFLPFNRSAAYSYIKLCNDLGKIANVRSRGQIISSADSISEARRLISAVISPPAKPDPTVSKTETVDEPIPTSPPDSGADRVDEDPLAFPEGPEPDLDGEWVDEPPAPVEEPKSGVKALTGREADAFDARQSIAGMMKTIDQWMRNVNWTVDKIRNEFPSKTGDQVLKNLQATYDAMDKWKKGIK